MAAFVCPRSMAPLRPLLAPQSRMRRPSKWPTRMTLFQARREEMTDTDVPSDEHLDVQQSHLWPGTTTHL